MRVDAIVNAANTTLLGGGGVDGAIHRAAGEELRKECEKLGGCNVGEAKITRAYKLNAKYVIHTVGPRYYADCDVAKKLASCYINSLTLAKENELHSIAFPAISTGAYRYPLLEATQIAIETTLSWLNQNNGYDMEVVFCCLTSEIFDIYKRVISTINDKTVH